jgi:hypothetical protein
VIIGHSERRTLHNESDEQVAARRRSQPSEHGLVPVICVGETAEDLEEHGPSAVPVAQLKVALSEGVPAGADIVVAYEPVWAIGSGQAATPEQAEQVCRRASRGRQGQAGRRGCCGDAHPLRRLREVVEHRRHSCVSPMSTARWSAARASTSPSSPASRGSGATSAPSPRAHGRGPAVILITAVCGSEAPQRPARFTKGFCANSSGRPAGGARYHEPPADPPHPLAPRPRWRALRHVRRRRHLESRSSGVAERNLNRFTVILGLVWVTCIVVLGLITKFDSVG